MDMQEAELQHIFLEAQSRFARHYLDFARQHHADFKVLDTELDNLLTAANLCLRQGDWQLLAEFTRALNDYWFKRGLWEECIRHNRALLGTDTLQGSDERARIVGQLALVEEARGDYAKARRLYGEQLQVYDQAQPAEAEFIVATLRQLVRLATLQGDYDEAQQSLERQLEILSERQSFKEMVDIMCELAALHHRKNDLSRAELFCQQGMKIAQRIGYRVGLLEMLRQQAKICHDQGNLRDAQEFYRAALDIALEMGDQIRASEIRERLATLEAIMGRSIFISYNHNDCGFVERLAQDLKATGLAVWWDEWEIKVGDSIIQKVSEGIRQSGYLAVVLSPDSVESPWVQRELGSALMRQLSADRGITVLPLLISDCEVPVLLQEVKWADFRQDYQTGLQELLEALVG